jgi:hypothetical protein
VCVLPQAAKYNFLLSPLPPPPLPPLPPLSLLFHNTPSRESGCRLSQWRRRSSKEEPQRGRRGGGQKWSVCSNLISKSVLQDVMELPHQLKAQFRVARRFVYWFDVSAGQILAKIIVRGESAVDYILRQHRQDCGQGMSVKQFGREWCCLWWGGGDGRWRGEGYGMPVRQYGPL